MILWLPGDPERCLKLLLPQKEIYLFTQSLIIHQRSIFLMTMKKKNLRKKILKIAHTISCLRNLKLFERFLSIKI